MTVQGQAKRFPDIDSLTDPRALEALLGPVRALHRRPLNKMSGFSGATHERIELELDDGARRNLVLKNTDLARDWIASHSHDTHGREALVLSEPRLAAVWEIYERPYLAYAVEPGRVALLSIDLSEWLFPNERAPIAPEKQNRLIDSMARMHARFWEADLDDIAGLADPRNVLDLVGHDLLQNPRQLATVNEGLRDSIVRGWTKVRELLPPDAYDWLTRPVAESTKDWDRLPWTLLHGDIKIANFAVLPSGRVAAFDWSVTSNGPCGFELGWYLTVNATRICGRKEAFLEDYRRALEAALGTPLDPSTWSEMVEVAIFSGARTLLWSKAMALEGGTDAARREWTWWEDQLVARAR